MPKVLRIINRFNLGGPTYNAAYLSKYLYPEFDTLLVGGTKDESEGDSLFLTSMIGLEPQVIDEMRRPLDPLNDIKAYRKIKAIIKDFKPDIVHTHASKAGALGRIAAWQTRVPVIVHTFHGHIFDGYFSKLGSIFFRNIERWLAKKTTVIIALSENQKYELSKKYRICPEDKIVTVPLGFDLSRFHENQQIKREQFRKEYQLEEEEIAIGIIGRLAAVKNHAMFIKAIDLVSKKTKNRIRIFIIGDGEEKAHIISIAKAYDLPFTVYPDEKKKSLITFTSWIKEVDVALAGLEIVALCSLNEGTPVSLIEAQAAGKAIVTTDVGGIENVVIPGETALLSSSNNVAAFAENLLYLVENEKVRQQMSAKGWNHVKERFHYTRLVSDISALYHDLLKN